MTDNDDYRRTRPCLRRQPCHLVTGLALAWGRRKPEHARLVAARRDGLAERLDGWEPEEHPELQRLLDRLTHDLISVIPTPPAARAG